jgi:hypothetical protein
MVMLKALGWVVGIVLFCWATVSAFSIFSELKFLVDGWTWSVDQVPVTIKSVALAVGKYVSGIIGGYREFVHGLVAMLRLPRLPQLAYDTAGVVVFSVARGYQLGTAITKKYREEFGGRWAHLPPDYAEALEGQAEGNPYLTAEDLRAMRRKYPVRDVARRLHEKLTEIFLVPGRYGHKHPYRLGDLKWIVWRTMQALAFVLIYGTLVAVLLSALFGIDFLYRHFA